jgi:hypothetical protein
MNDNDRLSRYFLIVGIILCLSVVFVLPSIGVWEKVVSFFLGKGYDLHRFYDYAFRASIFAYVILGVYCLIIATDPERYKPLIFVTLIAFIANAAVCLLIGIQSGISPLIFVGDTLFFLILAATLLYFWKIKKQ